MRLKLKGRISALMIGVIWCFVTGQKMSASIVTGAISFSGPITPYGSNTPAGPVATDFYSTGSIVLGPTTVSEPLSGSFTFFPNGTQVSLYSPLVIDDSPTPVIPANTVFWSVESFSFQITFTPITVTETAKSLTNLTLFATGIFRDGTGADVSTGNCTAWFSGSPPPGHFSWVCSNVVNGVPLITAQPHNAGAESLVEDLTFSVSGVGAGNLGYQWQYNGVNLTDTGRYSGSATPTLTIFAPVPGNNGRYQAVITNAEGSVTSSVATLTITLPLPTVELLSPTNSNVFSVPPAVNFSAAVSEPNAGEHIDQVAFLSNGSEAGVTNASPYVFIWTNAPAGTNILTAVVTDSLGLSVTSAPVVVQVLPNFLPTLPPASAVTNNGSLQVTLLPASANGQWRLPADLGWRDSGSVASNLTADTYTIEFRNEPGYVPFPSTVSVDVLNSGSVAISTNVYLPTLTSEGELTVNFGPINLVGGGWRFLGNGTGYLPSGYTTNVIPGTYYIEFAPVAGHAKPASAAVTVNASATAIVNETYSAVTIQDNGGVLPVPIVGGAITNFGTYPFYFNGQLQSDADVGFGSGVAVLPNVVLTAAHLVFRYTNLTYVTNLFWYLHQDTGTYQSSPLVARGWYVLSGYAAQRTNDYLAGLAGDQSSSDSRNHDVAAVYFSSTVAGGGYGGYVFSDATPNIWLAGDYEKMLVGYPVDGSLFGDATIVPGLMYQTGPEPFNFSVATETVTNLVASDPVDNQQVYLSTNFFSYAGNSGGPLYVQLTNGAYYPAGVYLGTLLNGDQPYASVVRAIDSNVVNLITLASTLGDSGTNNAGGGVVTIVSDQTPSGASPGYLQIVLGPPAVVQAGAAWQLLGDATYSTGANYTRAVTSASQATVQFRPVAGWNLPTNQSIQVTADGLTVVSNMLYQVKSPSLKVTAQGLGLIGTTNTSYRIERNTSLNGGTWIPVSTNMITSSGFNLVESTLNTSGTTIFYRAVWLP